MKRPFGTEPLDDTVVTYAWSDAEIAEVEAYVNRLPDWVPPVPVAANLNGSAAPILHNSFGADIPPITAPGASAAAMVAARAAFEAIVSENLRRGLYLSQRDALIGAARDPRCERRHVRVLAEIIDRMNSKTGMAYPGRAAIARDTTILAGGIKDPNGGYTTGVIRITVSDLLNWGYLAFDQRGPEGGGRAIAHYTVARPSVEDLQREITFFINRARERDRLDAMLKEKRADQAAVKDAPDPRNELGVKDAPDSRIAGVKCVVSAGVKRVVSTVTSKEGTGRGDAGAPTLPLDATDHHKVEHRQPIKPGTKKRNGAAAEAAEIEAALAAYNEAARMHGFEQCRVLTMSRRKRLKARLADIGGLAAFERALSAIPQHDFLMGRVAPKPGQARFKLDINRLMQTEGGLGDVLAKLLDLADSSTTPSQCSLEDEVRKLAGTDTGKKLIGRFGDAEGMQRLCEIVIENRRKRGQ